MKIGLEKEFEKVGIIPVIVLEDVKDAKLVGKALVEGGLNAAEVTFRTDAAEEVIKVMAKEFPNMLLGAGTVLRPEQADKAMAAGAKFLVSPGFNPHLVSYCIKKGYPIVPGIQTPSDIEQAMFMGINFVKFFPAEQAGGLDMIKALTAPYTDLKVMPTGGVSEKNVKGYLSHKNVVACGGTWMVKKNLIDQGDFEKIKEITKEAASIVKEIRG